MAVDAMRGTAMIEGRLGNPAIDLCQARGACRLGPRLLLMAIAMAGMGQIATDTATGTGIATQTEGLLGAVGDPLRGEGLTSIRTSRATIGRALTVAAALATTESGSAGQEVEAGLR